MLPQVKKARGRTPLPLSGVLGLRVVVGALLLACSPHAGEDVCSTTLPIVGASKNATPESERTLQALVGALRDSEGNVLCSGITVDPRWVLTARHCAEGTRFLSTYTTNDEHPRAARVTREYPHPELDVMLVGLADSAPVVGELKWPAASLIAEDWLGRYVTLAGRGEDEAFVRGPLLTTEELVSELDARFIAVDGGGQSGACAGDSGGPLLAIDEAGALLLLGTLSTGSASCVGVDRYVRSDLVRDWVQDVMAAAEREPCAGIPGEGFCEDGASVYCEDGQPARTFCTNHTLCGWSKPEAGYRCLDVDDDPCRGVGTRGACEGERLLTCEHGQLVERDCGACARCVSDGGGSVCR